MKKKRLISLMLAGVLGVGVAAMSGCEKDENAPKSYPDTTHGYVVLDINDTEVLHKGNIRHIGDGMKSGGFTGVAEFRFKCGKNYLANTNYFIYDKVPEESEYDQVCETCLSLEYTVE